MLDEIFSRTPLSKKNVHWLGSVPASARRSFSAWQFQGIDSLGFANSVRPPRSKKLMMRSGMASTRAGRFRDTYACEHDMWTCMQVCICIPPSALACRIRVEEKVCM
ncbi:uncharacterized protein CIMG_01419 [Coccidioides immitis RS]|uniref:Uncharacterized protein n=1 Tax=Coccidioides immitis (strain RS) TaxID=246410 RepID=A0A0E1RYP6_COCIM|nr:uncharacterized protein CIMG_01419 [Coccidioides immitis RS]EAS36065.2 hypothetical protein CIMG_01419 [Coccidioides immitis RS]